MTKTKLKIYLKLSRILFISIFLVNATDVDCQTVKYEDVFISHYFYTFINNIKEHCKPVFNEKESAILSKIKVVLDSSSEETYIANSDSKSKRITFSRHLAKTLVRFSVAQFIDFDTTMFNRKRFGSLYTSLYPFLNPSVSPEDAAELTPIQKSYLFSVIQKDEFAWTIQRKLLFLFLHEFAHQVQGFTQQIERMDKNHLSKKNQDSIILNLELAADTFALSKIGIMGLEVHEYLDGLSLFIIGREQIFPTIDNLTLRELNAHKYIMFGLDCGNISSDICYKLDNQIKKIKDLYSNYKNLHSLKTLDNIRNKAINEKDIFSLYNLGDFYLKGTTYHIQNLDSALFFFSIGAHLSSSNAEINSEIPIEQQENMIEYCAFVVAKIYEILKKNEKEAVKYYYYARLISKTNAKDYYDKIIERLTSGHR